MCIYKKKPYSKRTDPFMYRKACTVKGSSP
jgi:hypothetical protein